MSKFIPCTALLYVFLVACASSSRNAVTNPGDLSNSERLEQHTDVLRVTENFNIDTVSSQTSTALTNLPVSQAGSLILAEGFYEGEFKSYCLQPGTPSPSDRDAYLQAPLSIYKKDIVETILRNSLNRPDLDQKNIQLLLWSVVSHSNYNKLSREVQSTAGQLLTSKQIFQLKGGYAGVVKSVAAFIPESNVRNVYNQMNNLFELGTSSYEAYERIAVPGGNSVIHHPEYKKEQWYKQPQGYYVRYFPLSYKKVKIQVYVPKGSLDSTGMKDGSYLLFDPVSMMAIPANSNAQRLGIGAPVIEVIRKVIQIENQKQGTIRKKTTTQQPPKPAPTKGVSM